MQVAVGYQSPGTQWTYDSLGREASRLLPLGQQESYTYDAIGNRVTHTDFNGAIHRFVYDTDNDWLVEEQWADGHTTSYTYNAIGLRTQATNETGTYGYDYDTRDRLTRETKPNGDNVAYGYNNTGERTTLTTTVKGTVSTTRYTFDALGRMASVTDDENRATVYSYDEYGNQTHIAHANGTQSTTTFDALNRITDISHRGVDDAEILSLAYTLDPTGRQTRVAESTGRESTYTYDDLYRLTRDSIVDPVQGENHNATYSYDEVSNRVVDTVNGVQTLNIVDDNDRLLQQGHTTYQYDDNGNMISETLGGVTTTYAYDHRNKLVSMDKGGATVSMAYDPDGVRIQKTVDTQTTDYLIDSNRDYAQVLYERSPTRDLSYTFGMDLVGLITGSESYSYQTDVLGSTRLLSDAEGRVADTPAYDAWGVRLAGGTVVDNQYLYTGEQYDADVDRYYLRARYMDPETGRLTQADTWRGIDKAPHSLNRYLYVASQPTYFIDPSGLEFTLSGTQVTTSLQAGFSAGRTTGFKVILKRTAKDLLCVAVEEVVEEIVIEALTNGIYIAAGEKGTYAGQTNNFDRRIKEHKKNTKRKLRRVASKFEFLSENTFERRALEQFIMDVVDEIDEIPKRVKQNRAVAKKGGSPDTRKEVRPLYDQLKFCNP